MYVTKVKCYVYIGIRVIVLILPIIGAKELTDAASNKGGSIMIVSAYVIYDTEMSFLLLFRQRISRGR
jgi:hypothetical protein